MTSPATDRSTDPGSDSALPVRRGMALLTLVGPSTALTALLYYFGFVSAKAYYLYFGVSLSALDLPSSTYLVRSVDSLFRPVAGLLVVLVLGYVVHRALRWALERSSRSRARQAALALASVGLALLGVGLWGLFGVAHGLWSPISLAAAMVLMEYSIWTWAWSRPPAAVAGPGVQTPEEPSARAAAVPVTRSAATLRQGLVVALVLVSAFWAVTDVAQRRGTDSARVTEASLVLQSQAVVYSDKDLHLPGPGVGETVLSGPQSAYSRRYNGLRPLIHAAGRWFLLPSGWRHDNGATVIVLPDDAARIRVDLAPASTRLDPDRRQR